MLKPDPEQASFPLLHLFSSVSTVCELEAFTVATVSLLSKSGKVNYQVLVSKEDPR